MLTKDQQNDRDLLSNNPIPPDQVPDDTLTPELLDLIELIVQIGVDRQDLGNTFEIKEQ